VTEAAVAVEGGADFGTTEGQSEVTGTTGVNRINGKATGLCGGVLKNGKGGGLLVGHIE
jgi:hypothetical protein